MTVQLKHRDRPYCEEIAEVHGFDLPTSTHPETGAKTYKLGAWIGGVLGGIDPTDESIRNKVKYLRRGGFLGDSVTHKMGRGEATFVTEEMLYEALLHIDGEGDRFDEVSKWLREAGLLRSEMENIESGTQADVMEQMLDADLKGRKNKKSKFYGDRVGKDRARLVGKATRVEFTDVVLTMTLSPDADYNEYTWANVTDAMYLGLFGWPAWNIADHFNQPRPSDGGNVRDYLGEPELRLIAMIEMFASGAIEAAQPQTTNECQKIIVDTAESFRDQYVKMCRKSGTEPLSFGRWAE